MTPANLAIGAAIGVTAVALTKHGLPAGLVHVDDLPPPPPPGPQPNAVARSSKAMAASLGLQAGYDGLRRPVNPRGPVVTPGTGSPTRAEVEAAMTLTRTRIEQEAAARWHALADTERERAVWAMNHTDWTIDGVPVGDMGLTVHDDWSSACTKIGAAVGGAAGAAALGVIPGIGPLIAPLGATLGAAIGGLLGKEFGSWAGKEWSKLETWGGDVWDDAMSEIGDIGDAVGGALSDAADYIGL